MRRYDDAEMTGDMQDTAALRKMTYVISHEFPADET